MLSRNVLLVLASVLCVCSISSAQNVVLPQVDARRLYQPRQSQQLTVSSLPSDVFGESTDATMASVQDYATEEATVAWADTLILIGIAGATLAGISALGLLYSVRRKAQRQPSQSMQVIGI